ncbi:hypothetical protein [Actinotignum urinale]|uniref:hypothetical protein n=1 Tax=Actinotignum urinale TaxID=190146 RepID=UPI0012EC6B3E|nr:hypothetical protein [Actinotignum urinale]MDY5129469.1 hypothetical protein [Actinotignum urinale]MDY5161009.1 hypothetical protein [Actinotignum urinale]
MAEMIETENIDVVLDKLCLVSTYASLRFPFDSEVRALTEYERSEVRVLRSILEDVAARLAGGEDPYEWFSKGTSMPVGEIRPNTFQYVCQGFAFWRDDGVREVFENFGKSVRSACGDAMYWRGRKVWADYAVVMIVLGVIGLIDQRMAIPEVVEELSYVGKHHCMLYDIEECRMFDERGEYYAPSDRCYGHRKTDFRTYRFHN